MRSTELAVPVENTVRALRRLAPGARLRRPGTPELCVLAGALRDCAPPELARVQPGPVARVVLAAQLRALDRAMTGFFACDARGPEAARLVRAARYGRVRRGRPLRTRLATEPGLHAAALAWAEARGYRILAGELSGIGVVPGEEDGRRAAELAVAALLPRAEPGTGGREVLLPWPEDGSPRPGGGSGGLPSGSGGSAAGFGGGGASGVGGSAGLPPGPGAGGGGGSGLAPGSGAGEGGRSGLPSGSEASGGGGSGLAPWDRAGDPPAPPSGAGAGRSGESGGSAFLHVRSVRVTDHGFQVDVHADPPVELLRDRDGLTLRGLWWNGLGRIVDDLGHEYLLLAKEDSAGGTVRYRCHPRLAPGARILRLESAGYRGERVRLEPAEAGTCAEVLVKLELTVRLGG
ncbi:hypothetical protein [Amycolatopsis sp. MtRt-6]|uniref:hypothetical protein n=1 Tax=Amycolatopsis sp. MtRt-6 TaxID=2792782 RepID=UPI001A8F24E0|nr:hypothetical protein [Amycolatopsis sp. MtRt-6]